jgi:tetratricopeptide (TPR) repeat protein
MTGKKLTKQEMRDDEFRDVLSEIYFGIVNHITENWRAFAIGFAALFLLLAGALYLWQARVAKADHSSHLLGQLMDDYGAPLETGDTAKQNRAQHTFPTEAQRAQAVETDLAAYQKAVGASTPMAVYYKALSQVQGGKLSDAVATLEPITKGQLAPVSLTLRARLFEAQGLWDKAEADWKSLTALSTPTWTPADGYLALGEYYERRSQKDKAIEAYQQAEKTGGVEGEAKGPARRAKGKADTLKGKV